MKLNAYFERIGYTETPKSDLETLRAIVFAHATAIPFESLDSLSDVSVSLDIEAIEDKLVRRRRGGYCFEQNALLAAGLREVGFEVDELSARVWYNSPEGIVPPRTHVFLAVTIDSGSEGPVVGDTVSSDTVSSDTVRWLADCGVGGSTPAGLMRLDLIGIDQPLFGEVRRLIRVDGRLVPTYMHQVRHVDRWADVYEFTGETMPRIDQEMGNWWTSSHPDSKFRKNVIVALVNRDGTRCSIVNRKFVHRRGNEMLGEIEIQSRAQLQSLLQQHFGIELPSAADVQFLFE